MMTKLPALLLMTVASCFSQVSIGITIGAPPPPRVVRVRPVCPGPDFLWVDGYWYPVGNHFRWHDGYWTRAPYPAAVWVAPRYDGGRYYNGYWNGDHGRVEHDHHWDHDRGRRDHDREDHHDRGNHDRGDHDRGDHDHR